MYFDMAGELVGITAVSETERTGTSFLSVIQFGPPEYLDQEVVAFLTSSGLPLVDPLHSSIAVSPRRIM
jgi:hypothetical protein